MTDKTYSIYWKHPHYGESSFTIAAQNPQKAADWAAEEISDDYILLYTEETSDEDLERQMFLDDLEVDVYEGVCLVRPASPPLASYT